MKNFAVFFSCLTVIILLDSCGKEEKYPVEPAITFKNIITDGTNNFKLTLSFTDGDGDIGLTAADTVGPFAPGSKYFYNCFMTFYLKNGDVFEELNFNPPYNYRIPVITPKERNKNIKGDIEIALDGYLVSGLQDTLLVDVYIADRALHESNKVSTSEFVLKKP